MTFAIVEAEAATRGEQIPRSKRQHDKPRRLRADAECVASLRGQSSPAEIA